MIQSPRRRAKDHRIRQRTLDRIHAHIVQLPWYAQELWKSHRYKVLYGGRGGARSWTVARMLLLIAAKRPTRILCAREFQSSIKDSVHQLLSDQIALMHLTGFTVTDREIRHSNGSFFIFVGLRHNVSRVKSLEGIDICWVEEAERISKESWRALIPTIRKPGSEIWVTFNPDQEEDATYQRFVVRPAKDVWSLKVNWHDNPWFPETLLEEKDYDYSIDEEAADHVWEGNTRIVSDSQIMRGRWKVEEFTVPYETDHRGDRSPMWQGPYQGQDFGFANDPAACVRLWVHDRRLYVEHEGWKMHLEIDDTAREWNDAIPDFDEYITRADSARPDTISYLRRHGEPRIEPAAKHAGSVKEGIAHLRSYAEIIIHPRCIHFIGECKHYKYKVDPHSGDVLPTPVDKHNHLIDSARYALDPLIIPRRLAGFLWADGNPMTVCPVCESMLPDDGECPHCGAFVDMATGRLIDATEGSYAAMAVSTNGANHGNGNGNGSVRDDASSHSTTEPVGSLGSRLRGLND